MSEQVSSFIPVQMGNLRYLFLLVTWNDFVTPITEELKKQREPFGEVLGLHGSVIQAFRSATRNTFHEITAKNWPQDALDRMKAEQDPFMVIINQDFQGFDPQIHQWAVVWFSDFFDKPDCIYRVFAGLAQKVRDEKDMFEYLAVLAKKDKYREIAKHIEIKPGFGGISIDVKALMEDLLGLDGA